MYLVSWVFGRAEPGEWGRSGHRSGSGLEEGTPALRITEAGALSKEVSPSWEAVSLIVASKDPEGPAAALASSWSWPGPPSPRCRDSFCWGQSHIMGGIAPWASMKCHLQSPVLTNCGTRHLQGDKGIAWGQREECVPTQADVCLPGWYGRHFLKPQSDLGSLLLYTFP